MFRETDRECLVSLGPEELTLDTIRYQDEINEIKRSYGPIKICCMAAMCWGGSQKPGPVIQLRAPEARLGQVKRGWFLEVLGPIRKSRAHYLFI